MFNSIKIVVKIKICKRRINFKICYLELSEALRYMARVFVTKKDNYIKENSRLIRF